MALHFDRNTLRRRPTILFWMAALALAAGCSGSEDGATAGSSGSSGEQPEPGPPGGETAWALRIGGGPDGYTSPVGVAVGANDEIAAVGSFARNVEVGDTTRQQTLESADELFIARFDAAGQLSSIAPDPSRIACVANDFSPTFDPAGNLLVSATMQAAIDFGGVMIGGGLAPFVADFGPNGNLLSAKETPVDEVWNGGHGWAQGAVRDGQGNTFVLNESFRPDHEDLDYERWGFLVAKYGPDGALQWTNAFSAGEAGYAHAFRIVKDPSGSVVVVGDYQSPFDLGAELLPPTPAPGPTQEDVSRSFVARFDQAGKASVLHATEPGENVVDATVDVDSNLILLSARQIWDEASGQIVSAPVRTLRALDASGAALWTIEVEGCEAIAVDGARNVTCAGLDAAATSLRIAKYDPAGQPLWSVDRALGAASLTVRRVLVDGEGAPILLVSLSGSMDLGGGTVSSNGSLYDVGTPSDVIVKLTP